MAAAKTAWGIDVGQCALKALRLRQNGDDVEVIGFEYIEHKKLLSQPDVDRSALVREALSEFLKKHDLKGDRVAIGVPGQHTLSRFTKLPPVDPKKVPDIVRFEAAQQIPFDLDEVIWDYQTFQAEGSPDIEVGIFAMRRELIREHLQPFAAAEIEPVVVQSNPLALYSALRYDGKLDKGATVLVDIGTQNTDLMVADSRSLWSRNIPLGGNNFTEALVKTFKVSFSKAEHLKRTAATTKYARQVFQAMRSVFNDLANEIQRSIGFYSSTHRGVKLNGVLGMGMAFKLPGLQKFLQQNLRMEVVKASGFSKLVLPTGPDAAPLNKSIRAFGVAYGLGLQALGLASIENNLLPTEIAKQVVWRRKIPWFWGAAACLVFSAALLWGRYFWDRSALPADTEGGRKPTMTLDAAKAAMKNGVAGNLAPREYALTWAAAAEALERGLRDAQVSHKELRDNADQVASIQRDKALWLRVLDEFHSALPKPQNEIAEAMEKGPAAYKALLAEAGEKLARPKRRQIFIDEMLSGYSQDVLADCAEVKRMRSGRTGSRGGDLDGPGAMPPQKGFVVEVVGRTPNAGGAGFLWETLFRALNENKHRVEEKFGFYFVVDSESLCDCRLVSDAGEKRDNARGRRPRGARGSGGTGLAGSGGDQTDPITGEPTAKDYRFELVFPVVLGEPPEAKASGDL